MTKLGATMVAPMIRIHGIIDFEEYTCALDRTRRGPQQHPHQHKAMAAVSHNDGE
jgi:hypothetical protein